MEIIIGRESGVQSPRLSIRINNVTKFIGAAGSVPKSVSRTHCKLVIDDNRKIIVNNISENNTLFVNGLEYKTKTISNSDFVELGIDKYHLDIDLILKKVDEWERTGSIPTEPKTYNVSYLKGIWDNYTQSKLGIQINERKINALSAIPGVVSMISIALSFIEGLRAVFITVAAVFALTFAVIRIKSAGKVPLLQKTLEEKFQDEYVCPHCGHFLGNQRYELIIRNGSCPWCKSQFKE